MGNMMQKKSLGGRREGETTPKQYLGDIKCIRSESLASRK